MEIITEPSFLNIKNIDETVCPFCNDSLKKEIKKGWYLAYECGYCSYSNRPFAMGSSSLESHYPEGCKCRYAEKDFMYLICANCCNPKCAKCDIVIEIGYTYDPNRICDKCKRKLEIEKIKIEKEKFNDNWKKITPQEKLKLYGLEKIRILAKCKGIKGYSKYKKNELVNLLTPLVIDEDFPIKKK